VVVQHYLTNRTLIQQKQAHAFGQLLLHHYPLLSSRGAKFAGALRKCRHLIVTWFTSKKDLQRKWLLDTGDHRYYRLKERLCVRVCFRHVGLSDFNVYPRPILFLYPEIAFSLSPSAVDNWLQFHLRRTARAQQMNSPKFGRSGLIFTSKLPDELLCVGYVVKGPKRQSYTNDIESW
jgi:hypothetical protein